MTDLIKRTGSLPVFPSSTIESRFGELETFDLDMALEGNAIVINTSNSPSDFPLQSNTNNRIIPYVLNFKESTSKKAAAQYEGLLDGVKYYFDANGNCYSYNNEGNVMQFPDYKLWMLKDNIDISSGSGAGTRGDTSGNTTFAITSLLPREQIANYALEAILSTFKNPLSIDDAKINYISDLAHKIGFNMTQVAAQYRQKLNQGESSIGGNDEELTQEAETIDQKLVNEIRKILKEALNIKITEDDVQRDSYGLNISSDVRICNSEKDKPFQVQNVYSESNPMVQQLQDLNTKVNTLNQKVEAIDSTLTDIYDILSTTNNTLSSGLSSISTSISNALTSLSNAVTTAQITANNAQDAADSAQSKADSAYSKAELAQNAAAANSSAIETLQSDVSTINGSIQDHENRISALEGPESSTTEGS